MSVLNVGGLTKYYGAEFIFGGISFQAAKGDKVALVGVNGAGKSTLMKIIAGVEDPTSGGVYLARGRTLAYLAQEAQFSGQRTLMQEMHAALEHLHAMQQEISALEHALADTAAPDWEQRMERYGELTHRFEHAGGYDIEHRIDRTLHGLGFVEAQYDQPVAQFSGGQKTRAALASALLSDPDLLLLDEPTNHLDLAALEWLERFLKDWEGTLIVISHDRYFLDKVTNRTLEIANGKLDGDYPAPYNRYLELKAERLELQLKQYQAQQEYIAKTEEFIRRFKAGQRTKEARGREKILNRLKYGYQGANNQWIDNRIDAPQQQKKIAMNLGTQVRGGDLALKLEKLVVGYVSTDGRWGDGAMGRRGDAEDSPTRPLAHSPAPGAAVTLITCPNLEVFRGQRVALMGPNGSGKTTLLRTLVGEVPPLSGQARLGHRVTVNYYAQAHEGLQMDATVLEEIRRIKPLIKETEARTLLGRFLFSGDDVYKRVGDLSGGERSRVALAQLTLMGGNLLILDEPTNHLDIGAREALEVVLNEYNGTILFVSHDRYFIDAVADTIWMVENGSIDAFDGTYSEYAAFREARDRTPVADPSPSLRAGDRRPEARDRGSRTRDQGPKAREQVKAKSEPPMNSSGKVTATANGNGSSPASSPQPQASSKEERRRQRKLAALEEEIAMLEAEMKQLAEEMTAASAQADGKRVKSLEMQYTDVQEMLNTRYDEWSAVAG
ncbi:MAG TPA: ABC-F family ATP-binding cassette domain-containing protein [Roseiflexaceae bacterium]|nr:ABC-F family ATP-binding cassette domain-containing protein [Roseiflexaceae bacterium]